MFDTNSILNIFNEYNNLAIIISLFLSVVISLLGILPSIFVTGANILFFGPIGGFLISLLGETIGGYITLKVYRLGFKKGFEKISKKHELLKEIVNSEGRKVGILIFEGRLIPFMPSGVVTMASAISNVSGVTFSVATFLGKIPSIAMEALISYDIINISENYLRLIITLISLVILMITLNKFKKNEPSI